MCTTFSVISPPLSYHRYIPLELATISDEPIPTSNALQKFLDIAWVDPDSVNTAWDTCLKEASKCKDLGIEHNRICTKGQGTGLSDFEWEGYTAGGESTYTPPSKFDWIKFQDNAHAQFIDCTVPGNCNTNTKYDVTAAPKATKGTRACSSYVRRAACDTSRCTWKADAQTGTCAVKAKPVITCRDQKDKKTCEAFGSGQACEWSDEDTLCWPMDDAVTTGTMEAIATATTTTGRKRGRKLGTEKGITPTLPLRCEFGSENVSVFVYNLSAPIGDDPVTCTKDDLTTGKQQTVQIPFSMVAQNKVQYEGETAYHGEYNQELLECTYQGRQFVVVDYDLEAAASGAEPAIVPCASKKGETFYLTEAMVKNNLARYDDPAEANDEDGECTEERKKTPDGFQCLSDTEIGGPLADVIIETMFLCEFAEEFDWVELKDLWIKNVKSAKSGSKGALDIEFAMVFSLANTLEADWVELAGGVQASMACCQESGLMQMHANEVMTREKLNFKFDVSAIKFSADVKRKAQGSTRKDPAKYTLSVDKAVATCPPCPGNMYKKNKVCTPCPTDKTCDGEVIEGEDIEDADGKGDSDDDGKSGADDGKSGADDGKSGAGDGKSGDDVDKILGVASSVEFPFRTLAIAILMTISYMHTAF